MTDRPDPDLSNHFDRLRSADVPDVWTRVVADVSDGDIPSASGSHTAAELIGGGDSAARASRFEGRRRLGAAAAVLLVAGAIAGLVWSVGGGDDADFASVDAPVSVPVPVVDSTVRDDPADDVAPLTTVPSSVYGSAIIDPEIVAVGEQFSITPAAPIQPICLDPLIVRDATTLAEVGVIGGRADGAYGVWGEVDFPECLPEISAEPVTHTIPDGLELGTYVVCRTFELDESGCGTLTVADVSAPATTAETTQPIDAEPKPVAMSPLSPRSSAMAVWTGTEVLVIGGEPRSTCPPGGDCIAPDFAPLADGAAYDPAADSWRTVADAPLNMSGNARPVVVGDLVYVLVLDASWRPGGTGGFLEYDTASNSWRQLPTPGDGRFEIARFGDSIVAFRGSDEASPAPDLVFDTISATWQSLPDDPLSPSFDRTMVSVGGDLFLFAKDLVANPGSEQPSLVRTAVLDPATMTWTLRSDSEILGSESPVAVGREVIFANSGSADGGQVNNWGRSYPYGGIYNVDRDEWRSLPAPADDDTFQIAGVIGPDNSLVNSSAGHVLLANGERWIETPYAPFDFDGVFNQSVAATDTSIFVFGGEQWAPAAAEGTLTNDASIFVVTESRPAVPSINLFAAHERWVATDLDGAPVTGGPTIESAASTGFVPPDRLGLIGGCALDAASFAFTLDGDTLVLDPYPTIDFDCQLETASSQVDTIRTIIFDKPTITIVGDNLQLTNGINILTYQPQT